MKYLFAGYPEFQNLLTRSGLLDAAIAAINDNEPYVRASAVSVIAAAAQVPQLWQHLMSQMDVVERCYGILRQDSEALARRAAAKALTHIVQAEHFPYVKFLAVASEIVFFLNES